MNPDRRRLLQLGVRIAAGSSLFATLGAYQRALAATASASGDYRALVCVFLFGGCDTANLVVPTSASAYGLYSAIRSTLTLPLSGLLSLNSLLSLPLLGSNRYGFHASCPELQSLYNNGKLAIVGNVGPLVAPLTRAQFQAKSVPLPPQLFSHIDQQRQVMAGMAGSEPSGWAGRVADLMASAAAQSALATNISIAGRNTWQAGIDTVPYVLSSSGAPRMRYWQAGDSRASARRALFTGLLDAADAESNPMIQQVSQVQRRAISTAERLATSLNGISTPVSFPSSSLGQQLAMVAKMIAARGTLGVKRQLFFVSQGGYDTHDNQLATQAKLFADLSASLGAFQASTEALGVSGNVTAFTATDFGRTLTANSDGSDHGWGSQSLVIGGGVTGGGVYGAMPSLLLNNSDDAGSGRVIPYYSTEQLGATLASWFGVSSADLDTVFPNLRNFSTRSIGFMSA